MTNTDQGSSDDQGQSGGNGNPPKAPEITKEESDRLSKAQQEVYRHGGRKRQGE